MNNLIKPGSSTRSFCTFRLTNRLYGIEVLHVREISPYLQSTAVPQAPPAVHGLVNLRSRIYLALDLRPLLGLSVVNFTDQSRLIILKPEIGQDVGILIEQGGDIVHVNADQIERRSGAGDSSSEGASLIAGVCKLESELMIIVEPARIAQAVTRLFNKVSR